MRLLNANKLVVTCETQWVRTSYYENSVIFRLMFTCLVLSKMCGTCASAPELGLHDLCRFLERTRGGSVHTNDVILLYLDMCLITLVS